MPTPDGSGAARPRTEIEVRDAVVAAVAVHAATGVPGVVRMAPGVPGLVSTVMRAARERLAEREMAATEGVRVRFDDDAGGRAVRLELDIVTDGRDQAAAVARDVQRTVAGAVTTATGMRAAAVTVTILDVEIPVGAR